MGLRLTEMSKILIEARVVVSIYIILRAYPCFVIFAFETQDVPLGLLNAAFLLIINEDVGVYSYIEKIYVYFQTDQFDASNALKSHLPWPWKISHYTGKFNTGGAEAEE